MATNHQFDTRKSANDAHYHCPSLAEARAKAEARRLIAFFCGQLGK